MKDPKHILLMDILFTVWYLLVRLPCSSGPSVRSWHPADVGGHDQVMESSCMGQPPPTPRPEPAVTPTPLIKNNLSYSYSHYLAISHLRMFLSNCCVFLIMDLVIRCSFVLHLLSSSLVLTPMSAFFFLLRWTTVYVSEDTTLSFCLERCDHFGLILWHFSFFSEILFFL